MITIICDILMESCINVNFYRLFTHYNNNLGNKNRTHNIYITAGLVS
jgi:hypothetical protein